MKALRAGYLSIAVYCVSTALSAVWVTFSFSQISGAALTFITLLTAFVIFFGAHLLSGGRPSRLLRTHLADVVILNVLTVAAWFFMFLALQRIEASVESAIYQGCVPVAVLVCVVCTRQVSFQSLRTLGCVLISLCLFGLVAARITTAGAIVIAPTRLYAGIALATVAGLAGGLYVYWSGKVVRQSQCATLDILSNRFYLLLVVTGVTGYAQFSGATAESLAPALIGKLVLLSMVSVVIPAFTLQHAIGSLGASRVSIITPFVPALALVVEQRLAGWPSSVVPALIVATCVAIVLSNVWLTVQVSAKIPVR
ncbi:EamA family transporter [Verminephrobacter eiseniae]|uniref:EamA family transporter n=1 Tax=Verminephrobacter eiseniae TaxID=364317 RepID=UPI0022388113|nr:EamA family transporter [Verminephrobacter eiseniae]MCW5237971.1 hypothetical protein [Verminephrobacter eiseniae]